MENKGINREIAKARREVIFQSFQRALLVRQIISSYRFVGRVMCELWGRGGGRRVEEKMIFGQLSCGEFMPHIWELGWNNSFVASLLRSFIEFLILYYDKTLLPIDLKSAFRSQFSEFEMEFWCKSERALSDGCGIIWFESEWKVAVELIIHEIGKSMNFVGFAVLWMFILTYGGSHCVW